MASQDADREGRDDSYRAPRVSLKLSDFELLRRLGDGSFCEVYAARRRSNSQEYALKVMDKHLIIREKKQQYVAAERSILDRCNSPLVASLHFTFQDATSLYMGLEVCSGGELFDQIQKKKRLDLDSARFYAAEMVLMLEYLRTVGVVHRDLKPENLMLTAEGHLKLIDFGSAKDLGDPRRQGDAAAAAKQAGSGATAPEGAQPRAQMGQKMGSLTGTADYVSPEMLNSSPPISFPADLWALGCCVYQMLAGRPPFRAASEYLTFERIVAGEYEVPEDFPKEARSLVEQLLVPQPDDRLGACDLEELKDHPFFQGVDWQNILDQRAPAFEPPKHTSEEVVASDWELQSLNDKMQQAHMAELGSSGSLHGAIAYDLNPEFGQHRNRHTPPLQGNATRDSP